MAGELGCHACGAAAGGAARCGSCGVALCVGGDRPHNPEPLGSGSGARLVTVQGVSVFLLVSGLVGLALLRGSGTDSITAVAGGLVAGLGAMTLNGLIFRSPPR